MKTMRVIVFALLSSIPGTLLAVLIYWLIGEPEVWDQTQYLTSMVQFSDSLRLGLGMESKSTAMRSWRHETVGEGRNHWTNAR